MEVFILIVDDNQANLDTLHYLIDDIEISNDINIKVIESNNGNDALALALKYDFALIILDIQMPEMDGFEVAKFLKKSSKTKDIPVVFLTAAFKSEDMREYGLHLGAYDYFLKPIDPLIMVPKIKLYVNFYITTSQLKNNNKILEQKVQEAVEKNSAMETKLFEAQKLSSMADMISNIAHQWRQPLSVISTSATGVAVKKEYDMLTDEFLFNAMETIEKTAQSLSQTIDELGNYLSSSSSPQVEFDVALQIQEALELESSTFEKYGIQIVTNFTEGLKIKSFPNGLRQVVLNIINNAVEVLVKLESQKYIFVDTFQDESKIYISIQDNGGGIEDSIIHKVFEPYFTTKHQSVGTGLGLHIVYNLVKNGLDGNINVENKQVEYKQIQYKGACFTIELPFG